MSLEVILHNIYSFLDVLQSARGEKVSKWDEQALKNAFKWADYCKQIHTQAEGKPYESDLNTHIIGLGRLPWSLGSLEVNLQLLQEAPKHLFEALIQNPWLSSSLYSLVMQQFMEKQPTEIETLIQYCEKLTTPKNLVFLLTAVFNGKKSSAEPEDRESHSQPDQPGLTPGDDRSPDDVLSVQAALIRQYMTKTLAKTPPANQERTRCLLHKKLAAVWNAPHGKTLLLSCLSPGMQPGDDDNEGRRFILEFTCQQVEGGGSSCLEKVSKGLLGGVALAHSQFADSYLNALIRTGETLQMNYCTHQQRIVWRSTTDDLESVTYEALVGHIRDLIEHDPRLAAKKKKVPTATLR